MVHKRTRHKINCLHTLRRKFHKSPNSQTNSKITSEVSQFTSFISNQKVSFEADLVPQTSAKDNAKLTNYIKLLSSSGQFPSLMTLDSVSAHINTDKANLFIQFFYSIFSQTVDDTSLRTGSAISVTVDDVYNALVHLNQV